MGCVVKLGGHISPTEPPGSGIESQSKVNLGKSTLIGKILFPEPSVVQPRTYMRFHRKNAIIFYEIDFIFFHESTNYIYYKQDPNFNVGCI